MSRLLLDTPVWLGYVAGSPRLPGALRAAVDAAVDECWLSPMSVWEAERLVAAGRLRVQGGFRKWLAATLAEFPLREAALNVEVARRAGELELATGDPVDAFLVATALVYELTFATADPRLRDAGVVATIG